MKGTFVKMWLIWGFVLLVTLAFCYAKVFVVLMGQWWSNDMYSYGFLIPGISLYLIWMGRKRLSQLELDPHYTEGFIVLISGLLMLIIGQAGGVIVIQELSLIVTITGVVLLILGKQFLKALWFPIAYLLFMIPIWEIITDRLHAPFQSFTANIGVAIMQSIGIPAHRNGLYIELPNIILEVAKVCSGVNYLIAVIAIGVPVSYFFLEGWKRRAILIGFAVIVAGLTNSLRVGLIGIFSYHGLVENLHGPFHVLQALSVSFIGYGALFLGLSLLARKQDTPALLQGHVAAHEPSGTTKRTGKAGYLGMSISLIFLLVGSYLHYYKPLPVPLKADLRSFPLTIGAWRGKERPVESSVYRNLGVDQELSRVYRDDSGKIVGLYVGYYEYQEQGKELISYKTE
ncbi:MAG: exosortase W, partial [Nitrospira sp.]|nr:exosortase W [Nitrospira sp.]